MDSFPKVQNRHTLAKTLRLRWVRDAVRAKLSRSESSSITAHPSTTFSSGVWWAIKKLWKGARQTRIGRFASEILQHSCAVD